MAADRGPFFSRPPLEEVVSLPLFLLASTLPLLCLSAVIRERDRASLAAQESESALRVSYGRVRELAGKLITAQELERSRIARDLHDDLNQQLAALSISISALRRRSLEPSELNDALRALQERTVALVDQVRDLSHDLHPPVLDHVGLVPALRAHCADFARQHRLDVRFSADGALAPLPRDVAVCLYRIVQEGLRNFANHAGVPDASVSLTQTPDLVELTIGDRGVGFDPDGAAARRGLGLLSIEERARLVGGTFEITSTPDRGTTLHLQVPARAAHNTSNGAAVRRDLSPNVVGTRAGSFSEDSGRGEARCRLSPPLSLHDQHQPTRSIRTVFEPAGFATTTEDGREAEFRLANRRLQPLGHLTLRPFDTAQSRPEQRRVATRTARSGPDPTISFGSTTVFKPPYIR